MKSKTFKKLTAVVLAVMLTLSMCVTGISASAAAVSDGTRVVYLKPSSNWTQKGARFAVYLFQGSTNTWTDMSDEDGDGYYEATLPEGEWEKVIFCRMNPNATENNWNTKWNQTLDLDIPDDMNCYTVKEATWDNGGGEWSLYDPENPPEPPSTEATEGTTKQVITGDPDSYYLFGYINNANYACEEDTDNAGEYKFVDNQVTAKFDANSYVAVKKGDNSAWYMTEGWLGESVTSALLKNTNDIASGANKLFVPGGVEVTFTLVDNGDDTFTLSYASATDPTGTTDPTEVTEPTEPVPVDYYLFGSINGANYGCEEDYANMGDYKFVDGKLTVEFTEMSYVGVKTTDNGAWYMTNGWQGIVNEVTLYNTSTLDDTADKLVVPAGVVNFTLVVNDDDTLTLSYESDVDPTIPTEGPTDPVESTVSTEPTEPVPVDYYLFGSINGANYGCEEDYANMGGYKFVDNEVTVTFTETSYVGVKTTDNGAWYMTDGWQGDVTEVTLYNTKNLDDTADKLMVPAGEVKFTLVVNDDDTLTLSYTVLSQPTTEPTTEPATEPTLPSDSVSIYGDVNLDLAKDADSNVYTGKVDLQAGTYTFRINELGTAMCYGGTFTDTMNSILYSSAWKSATTFNVTGGRYTFSYNADTDKLTVKFKSFSEIAELFGDINVELVKSKTGLFSGIARLDAGTYTFRINDQGTTKCCGSTFSDSIYQIVYNSAWTSATTFKATGGTYSIQYDPSTSKLKMLRSVGGAGDVRIFGDIELDLVKEKGTIYSASTNLEAGTYAFRVDDFGTTMCNGSSFTDSIYNIQYSSAWKSESTLTVTGGKYTFTYDTETDKLKVLYTPAANTVSIYGDFDLLLTKGTGNVYSGSIDLEAGTYSFRIDELGTTMCNGGTYTDKINQQYSSAWKAATKFNATGGTYKFVYNADTDKLLVTYTAA